MKGYALNRIRDLVLFEVYALIKEHWALWVANEPSIPCRVMSRDVAAPNTTISRKHST